MTELHIWVYAGMAVMLVTAFLFLWAIREMGKPGIHQGIPMLIALVPLALYIGGVGLRIFVYVITWLIQPIIGAL